VSLGFLHDFHAKKAAEFLPELERIFKEPVALHHLANLEVGLTIGAVPRWD